MTRSVGLIAMVLLGAGCKGAPPEPEPEQVQPASTGTSSAASNPAGTGTATLTSQGSAPRPSPASSARIAPDDPLKGQFSLDDALAGVPGKGEPVAEIRTGEGTLTCELYEDKAPNTVANFIGLARGVRPWKAPNKEWVKRPAYDGTTFHRIIKGFMIQGGDAEGTGRGEPGYVIPDEIWPGARHDQRGLLCMANRGKNTNGAQFFILDAPAAHLDGGYTIFGKCSPDSVIEKLANSEVRGDRAVNPPKIEKVVIYRKDAPPPAAKAAPKK